jgi:hypothetical protein
VGWAIDGANRNDVRMLDPTLDAVSDAGLLDEIGTLHLDRSYDSPPVRNRLLAVGIDQLEIQRRGTKLPDVDWRTAGAQPDRRSAQVLSRPRGS